MDIQGLRGLSKALLGNKYRLELAEAIHARSGQSFSAQSLYEETGITYARVREDLARLRQYGLLVVAESPGAEVRYEAASTVYWELCDRLYKEFVEGHD